MRNRERLAGILADDDAALFEKYNDCIDEYISAICEQAFCEGFCVGTRISSESLSGAEEILKRDCCL